MYLNRKYIISKNTNKITITDIVENAGVKEAPYMLLYHFNMGYPLLGEKSTLDNFIEWKMMSETEYFLGLELANCTAMTGM